MSELLNDFMWGLSNCDKVVVVLTGVGEKEFGTKEIYEAIDELKAKADKWDEKETPYKPTVVTNYFGDTLGLCKCKMCVSNEEKYCPECGQKLDLESEGKR